MTEDLLFTQDFEENEIKLITYIIVFALQKHYQNMLISSFSENYGFLLLIIFNNFTLKCFVFSLDKQMSLKDHFISIHLNLNTTLVTPNTCRP